MDPVVPGGSKSTTLRVRTAHPYWRVLITARDSTIQHATSLIFSASLDPREDAGQYSGFSPDLSVRWNRRTQDGDLAIRMARVASNPPLLLGPSPGDVKSNSATEPGLPPFNLQPHLSERIFKFRNGQVSSNRVRDVSVSHWFTMPQPTKQPTGVPHIPEEQLAPYSWRGLIEVEI
jgi:hypothetical protein